MSGDGEEEITTSQGNVRNSESAFTTYRPQSDLPSSSAKQDENVDYITSQLERFPGAVKLEVDVSVRPVVAPPG